MRNLEAFAIPLLGRGENTAAAPDAVAPGEVARLENASIVGPGTISQVPDWTLAATPTNNVAAPPVGGTESNASCAIYPFAQPTNSLVGAGVSFSFNTSDNKIYLHHLDESNAIIRTAVAYPTYSLAAPPQITGFEYFGKFIYCAYGREAASARLGLGIYDPSAGTCAVPTFDLVGGGAAAASLRFRGIAKHRGGTAIGWGYQDEEAGNIDQPATLRWSKYVASDLSALASWQEDTTDTSPGKAVIGTPSLPIIGCAASGQYTVLGKETECFLMEGDFSSQFYTNRFIGSHGPASTTGIVSYGEGAAWMSTEGPAISVGGGPVQLLGTNRLRRRLQTYFDLTYTCADHFAPESIVVFLCRRKSTLAGTAKTTNWPDELLCWDYQRDEFYVIGVPTTCFCVGHTRGPGQTLVAPTGPPVSAATTAILTTSATLNWANGDTSADVVTYIEYKRTADASYTILPFVASGVVSYALSALQVTTGYSARMRHFKNAQYSAYSAVQTFTTLTPSSSPSTVGTPAAFHATNGRAVTIKGVASWSWDLGWIRKEFSAGSTTQIWEGTGSTFAASSLAASMASSTTSRTFTKTLGVGPYYYWVRHVLADGTVGTEFALLENPILYSGA